MADLETIKKVLREIAASYPGRFQLEEDNIKAWTVYLADIDNEMLMNAVRSFISSSTHAFPPSIPEIRGEVSKMRRTIAGIPDVWEAWEDLCNAYVDDYGRITGEQDEEGRWIIEKTKFQFKHPLIEKVGRGLGWPKRFPTENEVADRAAFRDAYNAAMSSLTKEDSQLPQVREYMQTKQLETSKEIKRLAKGMEK